MDESLISCGNFVMLKSNRAISGHLDSEEFLPKLVPETARYVRPLLHVRVKEDIMAHTRQRPSVVALTHKAAPFQMKALSAVIVHVLCHTFLNVVYKEMFNCVWGGGYVRLYILWESEKSLWEIPEHSDVCAWWFAQLLQMSTNQNRNNYHCQPFPALFNVILYRKRLYTQWAGANLVWYLYLMTHLYKSN